jgi:hypothetical protein
MLRTLAALTCASRMLSVSFGPEARSRDAASADDVRAVVNLV